MSDPVLFTLGALALLLTPGPTNTLLAVAGASSGVKRSHRLVMAELAAYLLAISVLNLGAGLLGPLAQAGLRLLCALCLGFIALRLWTAPDFLSVPGAVTPRRIFIVTLLNPKALVFAFVLLPGLAVPYMLWLSALIVAASLSWLALGAMGGRQAGLTPRSVHRGGAVILLGFAGLLAASVLMPG